MGAWFAPNVPHAQKSFLTHSMELLDDVGHVESCFGPFGDILVSMQDWSPVCAKCTIGSKIVLDTPDGTPRSRGSSGSLIQFIWR
jgi:hypothetical protein